MSGFRQRVGAPGAGPPCCSAWPWPGAAAVGRTGSSAPRLRPARGGAGSGGQARAAGLPFRGRSTSSAGGSEPAGGGRRAFRGRARRVPHPGLAARGRPRAQGQRGRACGPGGHRGRGPQRRAAGPGVAALRDQGLSTRVLDGGMAAWCAGGGATTAPCVDADLVASERVFEARGCDNRPTLVALRAGDARFEAALAQATGAGLSATVVRWQRPDEVFAAARRLVADSAGGPSSCSTGTAAAWTRCVRRWRVSERRRCSCAEGCWPTAR